MSSNDQEVREELELHVELLAEQLIAEGMKPDLAQAEARRRFGDIDALQDECVELRHGFLGRLRGRATTLALSQRGYEWLLLAVIGWNLVWPMIDRGWVHSSWWATLGIFALAAYSGPELARSLAAPPVGTTRSSVPWRVAAGLAVVGLLPSLHAGITRDIFPEGREAAVTVWEVASGAPDEGWLDVAPIRPMAEVVLYGFGGPTPELMIPYIPKGTRSHILDRQVERGLGSPPRWVTVPMAALFHASACWALLCLLLLAVRSRGGARPATAATSLASPSLGLLALGPALGLMLEPTSPMIQGEVSSSASYKDLAGLLGWGLFLSWYLVPVAMGVLALRSAASRRSREPVPGVAQRQWEQDLVRALPLFLILLPLVLGAFERQSGFWSNEPWLVRLVGPTLLAAVLLTLLLARSGRAPGGDAAS